MAFGSPLLFLFTFLRVLVEVARQLAAVEIAAARSHLDAGHPAVTLTETLRERLSCRCVRLPQPLVSVPLVSAVLHPQAVQIPEPLHVLGGRSQPLDTTTGAQPQGPLQLAQLGARGH